MGKKKCRKTKVSKGQHSNVAASTLKLVVREAYEKAMDLHTAWLRGTNPWLTYPNPAKGTNQPFLRIRAKDLWGDPKRRFKLGGTSN